MSEPGTINEHTIACKKLARAALVKSGTNAKTVADAIGKDTSTLSRYLSSAHEHEMPLTSVLIFEALTEDRSVLAYIARELGMELREIAS